MVDPPEVDHHHPVRWWTCFPQSNALRGWNPSHRQVDAIDRLTRTLLSGLAARKKGITDPNCVVSEAPVTGKKDENG